MRNWKPPLWLAPCILFLSLLVLAGCSGESGGSGGSGENNPISKRVVQEILDQATHAESTANRAMFIAVATPVIALLAVLVLLSARKSRRD